LSQSASALDLIALHVTTFADYACDCDNDRNAARNEVGTLKLAYGQTFFVHV